MHIFLLQFDILWENRPHNFATVRRLLESRDIPAGSLIILPELFATGFSMNLDVTAEPDPSPTEAFLAQTAVDFHSTILGGLATRPVSGMPGRNELAVFSPEGKQIARYQKNHTFSYTGESGFYERGDDIITFGWAGFTVCPVICYDLRFPELFRRGVAQGANFFPVIANWPIARIDHWTTLLRARAIENQAIVAGVNRIGLDPKYTYPGRSMIINHQGHTLAEADEKEAIISAQPDILTLKHWREDFPALKDARL